MELSRSVYITDSLDGVVRFRMAVIRLGAVAVWSEAVVTLFEGVRSRFKLGVALFGTMGEHSLLFLYRHWSKDVQWRFLNRFEREERDDFFV